MSKLQNNIDPDQEILNEISAISGYSKVQIAEVWEFTAIYLLESYLRATEGSSLVSEVKTHIPKIGTIRTYNTIDDDKGTYTKTNFESDFELADFLKDLIIQGLTDSSEAIDKVFESKLNNSILAITG